MNKSQKTKQLADNYQPAGNYGKSRPFGELKRAFLGRVAKRAKTRAHAKAQAKSRRKKSR